ncbi:zinc ribbon domain-containing protein [Hydrogenoanaerobacterium sp.]|uniref:zinc ribbon domain-containing protein n=1 Tax=Hydrogenoanaerobacterium sp. TaxID=2953763 RepID=UPI00289BB210|nr:zinc ribbon domain-containing protein [Hydrogenoanaerobacterium sp.]
MFCRNCSAALLPNANVCTQCGVPAGQGKHFCPNCDAPTDELAAVCIKCGYSLNQPYNTYTVNGVPVQKKSKLAAGLLGILLGALGIHNFYLGYTNRAVAQLLLGTVGSLACGVGPMVSAVWGLVEGIQILTGTINMDANGVPLGD